MGYPVLLDGEDDRKLTFDMQQLWSRSMSPN